MIEAHSYQGVCDALANRFRTAYAPKLVNLTGLVFAVPDSPFAQAEILPFVDTWHHLSDNVTDYFCAGFGAGSGPKRPKDAHPVDEVRIGDWWFSAERFVEFVRDVEARTTWTHSGGADLLVSTVRYDPATREARFDFRSAIALDLDAAKKDRAFASASHLMSSLFRFAADINDSTTDPAYEYSDRQGLRIAKRTLLEWAMEALPKSLGLGARSARHFAARDISPRAQGV